MIQKSDMGWNGCVQFLDGTVSGLALEEPGMDASALYKKLLPLSGMGPFTAANVLQLLGHFERIPADTETARHLKHRHKLSGLSPRTLQEAAQKVGSLLHVDNTRAELNQRQWREVCF